MLDDLETNLLQEDKVESTSNKFALDIFNLPISQRNVKILSNSTSKNFIYLVTERSELLRIESQSLRPIEQAYTIESPQVQGNFHEYFTKIWTDREGNHSIIRYNRGLYYFNGSGTTVKELINFNGIEICAVGFDDRNIDIKSTGNFLVADFLNNIYEYYISIEKNEISGEYQIRESVNKLVTLNFKGENDEDEDINDPRNKNYDRIYGIRFFRATKSNLKQNENACYIIIVTRNRFYQFFGPGLTSFKQIFGRYQRTPNLFNESCKFFPVNLKRKGDFKGTELDILFKTEQRSTGDNMVHIRYIFKEFFGGFFDFL